jgi:hypothetical protein
MHIQEISFKPLDSLLYVTEIPSNGCSMLGDIKYTALVIQ